jgi:Zn-dependent peptidase ImmA (M78 family)
MNDIANKARELLSDLHELQSEGVGAKPRLEEFFPINLRQIVEEILGWQIEERTMIGFLPSGYQIIGQTNFDEKRILIDVGDTRSGERNYTLAHEIGHVTLHRMSYACQGFATRTHASRRNERLVNPDPTRSRLEREAQLFAAELLMPRKSVTAYFKLLFGNDRVWADSSLTKEILERAGERQKLSDLKGVAKIVAREDGRDGHKNLADFFGVSSEAMAVRLLRLGLIY